MRVSQAEMASSAVIEEPRFVWICLRYCCLASVWDVRAAVVLVAAYLAMVSGARGDGDDGGHGGDGGNRGDAGEGGDDSDGRPVVVGHHLHHRRRYHRRIIRTDRMPEVSLKTEVQLRDSASTETSASTVFFGTLMYP